MIRPFCTKAELESIGRHLAAAELPQVGTPYVSAYEAMALIKCGRKNDAKALVEKVWGSMLDAGATSFWEGFNPEEKSAGHRITSSSKAQLTILC